MLLSTCRGSEGDAPGSTHAIADSTRRTTLGESHRGREDGAASAIQGNVISDCSVSS